MSENKKSFEEKLKELECVVKDLEGGDVGLEEMLGLFEMGIALTRECTNELTEAEQKINVLIKKGNGELAVEPFAPME